MSDLDFAELGELLAAEARQPSFGSIRDRRRRRTQRWAVAAATLAVVATLGGVAATGAGRSRGAGPAGPPGPVTVPPVGVMSVQASPSGTLYAVVQRCVADCSAAAPPVEYSLLRSTDLGKAWTTVGPLDALGPALSSSPFGAGPGGLLVVSDSVMWRFGDETARSSVDGGRTWRLQSIGTIDGSSSLGVSGGTVWLGQNGQVTVADGGGPFTPTAAQPPGDGPLTVSAISAGRVVVERGSGHSSGSGHWYVTSDLGAHWAQFGDPCAGTSHPGTPAVYLSATPDGGLWAVCMPDGAGQSGVELATSLDGGVTWQPHAAGPGGDDVLPMSRTVAWRGGTDSDIYRTTDRGAHWNDVAAVGPAQRDGAPQDTTAFYVATAVDADTALYINQSPGMPAALIHLTRDGGHTWTTHPVRL
jgi:hypothetical protein